MSEVYRNFISRINEQKIKNSEYEYLMTLEKIQEPIIEYISNQYSAPGNLFEDIQKKMKDLKNNELVEHINYFISRFQTQMLKLSTRKALENPLNPLNMTIDEDGDAFIEWIFHDFRIGFNFEQNIENSMWFLVKNDNAFSCIQTNSGTFTKEKMDTILSYLIKFALENS